MADEQGFEKVHKFELAGLGKAPFRFAGMSENKYQACHGAPIQPGGTCDYCGNAIVYEFHVDSSDGKSFKVGCECIRKYGDAGLKKIAVTEEAKRKRELARKARERRIEKLEASNAAEAEWFASVREFFAAMPSPQQWQAEQGDTFADHVEWMAKNAGVETVAGVYKWAHRLIEAQKVGC